MTTNSKQKTIDFLETLKSNIEDHGFNPDGVDVEELNYHLEDLRSSLNSYNITSVAPDDLYANGLCPLGVTSDTYERLASKMADDYCEQLFHTSLVIIAEDGFDIPSWETLATWLLGWISDMLEGGGEVSIPERLKLENFRRVLQSIENNLEQEAEDLTVESFTEAYKDFKGILDTYNDPHWLEEFNLRAPALLDFIQVRFSE